MLIKYFKAEPTSYILAYRSGRVVREGQGLTFFYTPHNTSLAAVPTTTQDVPFVFHEATADYQDVTIQGHVTYRLTDPRKAAEALDFRIDPKTGRYATEEPEKLQLRIVNALQGHARPLVRALSLEEALAQVETLAGQIAARLGSDSALAALGVTIESLYIVNVAATPELKKALEADYRESLNRRADLAIYGRRTAALAEERKIKQAELDTEKEIERGRTELVASQAENRLKLAEADAKAEEMKLNPYAGMPPQALIGLALKDFAGRAGEIGQLNITPDMLSHLASWLSQGKREEAA